MPENKDNKYLKWIGNIMAVSAFVSLVWGGLVILLEPHIETFIMSVVDKNKGSSTRGDLAKEMGIDKDDVCEEIGTMYIDFKSAQENIETFNQTWIPYLEGEKAFFYVGFFVRIVDGEFEMWYKDFDSKEYRAWSDEAGWFYQKQGYKFYK
jgi:hypothetical protein